jgi:hypothetical protein
MATTSSYIQISEYALIEYIYNSDIIPTTKARPLRLYNNYSLEYYYVNNAQSIGITQNVLDNTATRLGREGTKWAYMDIDPVAPVITIDNNFSLTDLTSSLITNIQYDKVKLHLLSGFDFPGLDGIILQIRWNEWNENGIGGRNFNAASQVYIKGEERIEFNLNPLFVGDRLYDKYIEFLVPSLSEANFDFWNSPTAPNTLGYNYTFNNIGFSQTSQITAQLFEINTTLPERGNRYFITGESYTATFNPEDVYSYISANVQENDENDYIEYYPTWNGQFIEDYIPILNSNGGDWVVVNQIEVNEQIGTLFVNTYSLTSLQDTNLNQPAIFRPVIRNAAFAIAFNIVYTMRLMNRVNGQEIIRQATYTSFNPKKYGEKLNKINVLEGYRPVKVYNKIVKLTEDNLTESVQYIGSPTVMTQTVFVNSYYDFNMISVDSTTSTSDKLGGTIWGQGDNTIFITKFDNYVKFKIFTKSADKKQNVSLDLNATGMDIKLAFIYDDQSKIYIDPLLDQTAADPGAGEILFRIDDSISTRLLAGKTREYYIVNKNSNGDEVLMYGGGFADQKDRPKILKEKANKTIAELEKSIAELRAAQLTLTQTVVVPVTGTTGGTGTASSGNSALITSQSEQIANAQNAQTFASAVNQGTISAITTAAGNGNITSLNLVDVPGLGSNGGANINSAKTPTVVKPGNPKTQISKQNVSTSALQKEDDNL